MEYEEFGRKAKQAFEDSKRRYGAVKLCRVLGGAGTPCSIKRVQRHMAEQGLRSVAVKKYSHHAKNPYGNACMESFHSVLKKEEIYLHTYQDSKEARRAIFEYIEGWYNRKRIHSSIGYLTPQQKEDKELKKTA